MNASLLTLQQDIITTHETFYPLKCKLEPINNPQQKLQKNLSLLQISRLPQKGTSITLWI